MEKILLDFFKYHALLESFFIFNYSNHVSYTKNGIPHNMNFKAAFVGSLENIILFQNIDWASNPFSGFQVLANNPPKILVKQGNSFQFIDGKPAKSWNEFIDNYRHLRNNIIHGIKSIANPDNYRDVELVSSWINFIEFLGKNNIVKVFR